MASQKINEFLQERSTIRNVRLIDQDELKGQTTTVSLNQLVLSKNQPRRYFDPQAMEALIASVKKDGILQPILVRPLKDKYEIVAGERRYRAALEVGLTEIPIVSKEMTDIEANHYALTENLQRDDLNPVEETESLLQLLALTLNTSPEEVISLLNQQANAKRGFTDNVVRNDQLQILESVFQSVGKLSPESFRTHRLPLLNLPPNILEAPRQGKIEYTKAKAIAKVKEEEARTALLEAAIQNSLSLSEIKTRIAALKPSPDITSPKHQVQKITRRLNQLKLWEKDKKTWKKVEGLLGKIETLLAEVEPEETVPVGITSESLAEIFEDILTEK
ncbi:MAG: ParB/RepB/Spo0J family partition protein [Snowella sp.]|nr:ParB/RepB/Spo0J family partition protein [Snowella sp.]